MLKIYFILLLTILTSACAPEPKAKGPCHESTLKGQYTCKGCTVLTDWTVNFSESCQAYISDRENSCVTSFAYPNIKDLTGEFTAHIETNTCGLIFQGPVKYEVNADKSLTLNNSIWR